MKRRVLFCFFFLLFFIGVENVSLFAQEWYEKINLKENFQLSDSLQRGILFASTPSLGYVYYMHKVFGVSHYIGAGYVSCNYLPVGLPGISETNTPLLQPTFGFAAKFFLGNILYNVIVGVGRTALQLPLREPAKTVQLANIIIGFDIGYAVWKTNNFSLTPCLNWAVPSYTFDTTNSWKIFTPRHNVGGAIDMSYFVPIADSPFQPLNERKVGMKEIIEAMISLRIGYSQSFEGSITSFSNPTHQEIAVRVMAGISLQKFVED